MDFVTIKYFLIELLIIRLQVRRINCRRFVALNIVGR
jgi:hypothetical protein